MLIAAAAASTAPAVPAHLPTVLPPVLLLQDQYDTQTAAAHRGYYHHMPRDAASGCSQAVARGGTPS